MPAHRVNSPVDTYGRITASQRDRYYQVAHFSERARTAGLPEDDIAGWYTEGLFRLVDLFRTQPVSQAIVDEMRTLVRTMRFGLAQHDLARADLIPASMVGLVELQLRQHGA